MAFRDPRLFHPVWNVCRRPHSPSVSVTWLESTSHPGVLPSFFHHLLAACPWWVTQSFWGSVFPSVNCDK